MPVERFTLLMTPKPPVGIRCLPPAASSPTNRGRLYRGFVLVCTFFIYMSYHLSRKAISVVKTAWNCTYANSTLNDTGNGTIPGCVNGTIPGCVNGTGWAPFDGPHGKGYLGTLDTAFLIAYAVAMFFSGHIGDRMNLRYFLCIGMLGSGIFTAALGLPYYLHLHGLWYFILMQVLGGAFQSTGWPSVVAVMANWFGKGNRGLIMGIWTAHTSVGNILGSIIAGAFLPNWAWSFFVPGMIIGGLGILIALFLPSDPVEVSVPPPDHHSGSSENDALITNSPHGSSYEEEASHVLTTESQEAVGIIKAMKIPGVMEYSLSLFFSKLVAYTFLYWLPIYIKSTLIINGKNVDDSKAAYYSTLFDVGGIAGAIAIGWSSDVLQARGLMCVIATVFSIPSMFFYDLYGGNSEANTIALSLVCGFFVNGPYSLITTAVSADLGTHKSLRGNEKAKATVAAFIDGTGSIGAALGPFLTGWIAGDTNHGNGWHNVFYMLIAATALSGVFLMRICVRDVQKVIRNCRNT